MPLTRLSPASLQVQLQELERLYAESKTDNSNLALLQQLEQQIKKIREKLGIPQQQPA